MRRKRLLASLTELLAAEDEDDEDGEDTEMTTLLNTLEGIIKKARKDGGASLVEDLKKAILGTATRETKEQEHLRNLKAKAKGTSKGEGKGPIPAWSKDAKLKEPVKPKTYAAAAKGKDNTNVKTDEDFDTNDWIIRKADSGPHITVTDDIDGVATLVDS